MEYDKIIEMVKEVSNLGLTSFDYTEGNIHISMNFPTADKVVVPKDSQPAVQAETAEQKAAPKAEGQVVTSPLVGTFYAAPAEGSAPYVKEGDTVSAGQTLGIVEAMKLMNEIECEYDGVIDSILVKDGSPVEYGQPLFTVRTGE